MSQSIQHMPVLEITSWDYADGSVGAIFDDVPTGTMWAIDDATMLYSIACLFDAIKKTQEVQMATQATKMELDLGRTECLCIDGKFDVRCSKMPNFGIEFDAYDHVGSWMSAIIALALSRLLPQSTSTPLQA